MTHFDRFSFEMDLNRNYPQFIEHSFRRLSLLIRQQDQSIVSSSSKPQSSSNRSIEQKNNNEPSSRTNRTYMRPPKRHTTTTTISHQPLDRSASCENTIEKDSIELPVPLPYERTPYDVKFEKDRQNNVREKFNIPPPFQRKWLRQPRYVPQERPVFGQVTQFRNE